MQIEESVALELVVARTPAIFLTDKAQCNALYAHIRREVESFVPDLSTETGRKAIASLAYKVARTKTAIDDAGAELKSEWLEKSKAVDVSRREIRAELDQLKELARKPLTDWEAAEEKRIEACKDAFEWISRAAVLPPGATSVFAEKVLVQVEERVILEPEFKELYFAAESAKRTAIDSLKASIGRLRQEEADRVELARLRKEQLARQKADEAAEVARLTKEREAREVRRVAEQVEAARLAEEQRVVREAEAVARAAREAEDRTKRELEAAAKKESDRIAAEHAAALARERELSARIAKEAADRERDAANRQMAAAKQAAEERKLAANKKHRKEVIQAAAECLCRNCGLTAEQASTVMVAIVADKIPAVSVRFGS